MDGGLTQARPLRSDDLHSIQPLADIDLRPGEVAMLSGGSLFVYDDAKTERAEEPA